MVQGLTSMKPRPVLLSSSSAKISSNGKPLSLSPEQRPLVLQAICHFLESSGFSKTLKKFLSEASLEKDSWKNCLLSLEDACCMYLDARSQNDTDANVTSEKISEKIVGNDTNIKSKEKKKKKSGKDSSAQNVEVSSEEPEVALEDTVCEEKSSKKGKDKKKKKGSEPAPESLDENLPKSCAEKVSEESNDPEESVKSKRKKHKSEGSTEQDKKSSKKRKKSSSEENTSDGLREASEDSKRRKTVVSGDEGNDKQVTKATEVAAGLDGQLENGQVDAQTPSFTTGKHSKMLPGDNDVDKSTSKKGSEKKQNGSTEPRVQIAFQRVKADEVEFEDERLQDNSYWAKDGAESGYGAKAQEVLGQVRGRDFRHEKTKKKRGSYRGGMIDLHSHSVKFNYSDEDE